MNGPGRIIRRRSGSSVVNWPDHLHPVLRRIYATRRVGSVAELEYGLNRLCTYEGLLNIDLAAGLLADLIEQQKYILIIIGEWD